MSRFSADCSRRRSCLWRAGFSGVVLGFRSSVSRSRSIGAVAESVLAEAARREHVEIAIELAPASFAAIVTFVLAGAATQAHRAAVFVAVLDVLGKFDKRAKGTALSHCTSTVHPHRSENAAHHTMRPILLQLSMKWRAGGMTKAAGRRKRLRLTCVLRE